MSYAPVILKPHEPVAERVLLPGDPGRALRLAQQLIDGPRMLNHHRGLWGYSGPAADGAPLTVQSTGLGGPSAAAVVADAAIAADGASRALGAGGRVDADPQLTAALAPYGVARGLVASADIHDPVLAARWTEAGALACDLATAAVLAAAARHGAAAAAVLAITRVGDERVDEDALESLESALGAAGAAAFG